MAEKTAAGLVAWCKENVGMPYWYRRQGQKPTSAWLEKEARDRPDIWKPTRLTKARSEAGKYARCFDCVGLIKGYLWDVQPGGAWKYIAAQDKTADGMRAISNPQPVKTLPEIPGVLVFCSGHVGVYIGGGRVIECYGFKNVANRPLSAQKWTHWGKCPYIRYPAEKPAVPTLADLRVKPGDRVRIKDGTTNYWPGGPKMPTAAWFWKNPVFTVEKISADGKNPEIKGGEPCVLLGDGNNTWCAIKNLTIESKG